jgi:hypothetical protein
MILRVADAKQQLELWKTVATLGGVMILAGTPVLIAAANRTPGGKLEAYGLSLLIGGLLLIGLGLSYAFWQQHEWRRPPTLPRGLSCTHFPLRHDPVGHPENPHAQELVISVQRRIYPPDIRVVCSTRIRRIEATVLTFAGTPQTRTVTRGPTSIDATSLHFSPLEPIEPPASIFLTVFSDEPIRVRKIRRLRRKYQQTSPTGDGPAPGAS